MPAYTPDRVADQSSTATVPFPMPQPGRNRSGCVIYVANQSECALKMAAIIARGADINKTQLQQRRDQAKKKISCCCLCCALFKLV